MLSNGDSIRVSLAYGKMIKSQIRQDMPLNKLLFQLLPVIGMGIALAGRVFCAATGERSGTQGDLLMAALASCIAVSGMSEAMAECNGVCLPTRR
jgi:hypothetical protein